MASLLKVKGLGEWSVHMFQIFHLGCENVLPVGDLAVKKGAAALYCKGKKIVTPKELEQIANKWDPYKSYGSWYMYVGAALVHAPEAPESAPFRNEIFVLTLTSTPPSSSPSFLDVTGGSECFPSERQLHGLQYSPHPLSFPLSGASSQGEQIPGAQAIKRGYVTYVALAILPFCLLLLYYRTNLVVIPPTPRFSPLDS